MSRLGSLFALLMLVGCAPAIPSKPFHGAPTKLPQYHSQSRDSIVKTLGAPHHSDKYTMSQAVGELRIELQNTYPLSNPENANVQIEELTWQDGDYWITLWLHKVADEWVVLDSCRWHKDVAF